VLWLRSRRSGVRNPSGRATCSLQNEVSQTASIDQRAWSLPAVYLRNLNRDQIRKDLSGHVSHKKRAGRNAVASLPYMSCLLAKVLGSYLVLTPASPPPEEANAGQAGAKHQQTSWFRSSSSRQDGRKAADIAGACRRPTVTAPLTVLSVVHADSVRRVLHAIQRRYAIPQ